MILVVILFLAAIGVPLLAGILHRMSYETRAMDESGATLNPIGVKWTLGTIALTILGIIGIYVAWSTAYPLKSTYDNPLGCQVAGFLCAAISALWLVYAIRMVVHFVYWLSHPFHRT